MSARILKASLLQALIFACTNSTHAKPRVPQKSLSPKSKALHLDYEDYQECRKQALEKANKQKQRKLKPKLFKAGLKRCSDLHPLSSVYVSCKKEAFRAYKQLPDQLKSALQDCKKELKALSFNPNDPFPFRKIEDKIFFSEIGLNESLPVESLIDKEKKQIRHGPFDCQNILDVYKKRSPPDHLLFGNELKSYVSFTTVEDQKLLSIFEKAKDSTLATHELWGEPVYDPNKSSIASFFPLVSCSWQPTNKKLMSELQVHFLFNKESKRITPYFAGVFYQEKGRLESPLIEQALRSEFGENFTLRYKNGDFLFFSDHNFDEKDDEGDPFNLCAKPRSHNYVAVVAQIPNSSFVDYLLLSNIDNLCKHGDRLASAFLKKGL